MTIHSDKPTRFRVLDLETTGISPDDAVVEIAAVDLIGREIVIIGVGPHSTPYPDPAARIGRAQHHKRRRVPLPTEGGAPVSLPRLFP